MTAFAQNATAPPRSTRTSLKAPDTFDGSDPSKFHTFLSQIYLHIADRPQDFPTDEEKILYVWSYLQGTTQRWFEPGMYVGAPIPVWDGNFRLFIEELQVNFGPHDLIGDAEQALKVLVMKPTDRIATYQVDFDNYSGIIGHNNNAIHRFFYDGLPRRIKDLLMNTS